MKYALLLYQDRDFESKWESMSEEEQGAVFAQFAAFDVAAEKTGAKIIGGQGLEVSRTATTVRPASEEDWGQATVTDGPFAEVAEHLGGYYEIEARDLDHAIEVVKLLPPGTTEIRPIIDAEEAG